MTAESTPLFHASEGAATTLPVEIVQPTAIEAIQRAEIDIQIATARKYPRMPHVVKRDIQTYAVMDEETATACFYSLPRGGKNIQGPSVRLAEIAVSCYGNIRVATRIVETHTGDNPHVVVQAVAHDLEKNTAVTVEKRRRITGKKSKGGVIDEDDINLAANAGSAIAFRDAVFKVVPAILIKPALEAAKKVAIGDATTLVDRRAKCVEAFMKMGVTPERLLGAIEKQSVEEIGLTELETLLGMFNAIKEGASTVDEAFPQVTVKPKVAKTQPATEGLQGKPEEPAK